MSAEQERLEITTYAPGVDLYRVFDARTGRSAVAGYYDIKACAFHKFVNTTRGVQHRVNGKPLDGFGIQENAFQHLVARGCKMVYVHYAPANVVHESVVTTWVERGLLASYAGRQRFLGIVSRKAAKLLDESNSGRYKLTEEDWEGIKGEERQMISRPDFTPEWGLTAPDGL